jgi:hypothetical protein
MMDEGEDAAAARSGEIGPEPALLRRTALVHE